MRQKGYIICRLFPVELDTETGECELVCNDFLAKVFEFLVAPFWNGYITLIDNEEE
jgi:hypothetical protein